MMPRDSRSIPLVRQKTPSRNGSGASCPRPQFLCLPKAGPVSEALEGYRCLPATSPTASRCQPKARVVAVLEPCLCPRVCIFSVPGPEVPDDRASRQTWLADFGEKACSSHHPRPKTGSLPRKRRCSPTVSSLPPQQPPGRVLLLASSPGGARGSERNRDSPKVTQLGSGRSKGSPALIVLLGRSPPPCRHVRE